MPYKLNVIDKEGNRSLIEIEEGTTIRDAIEDILAPDMFGICGGNCACGTCHIYVESNDFSKLKTKKDDEINTLELAQDTNQYSRLSCQIEFIKEYNNITITIVPD